MLAAIPSNVALPVLFPSLDCSQKTQFVADIADNEATKKHKGTTKSNQQVKVRAHSGDGKDLVLVGKMKINQ